MRILRVCLGEAHSNKEIAQILGKDPATTLHHVRKLTDTGFLAPQPVRRGTRGSREIPYLATRKSWTVYTPMGDSALLDAFIEEVSLVPADKVGTARLGLRLSPERLAELEGRLAEVLNDFESQPDDANGDAYSLFLALHPDPNRP
jgi:hypothetical protein